MDDEKKGLFLQKLRKEKGLTQQQLGEIIHYSDKAISKWERGLSFPKDPEILQSIANVFGISFLELIYGERKSAKNKDKLSEYFYGLYKKSYKKHIYTIYISFSVILFFVIVSFFSIYFAFIKSKINSYTLSGESSNFVLLNFSLLITNKVDILNFTKVESNNKLIDDNSINKIKLYYLKDNKENLIFEGENDNYYIEELNKYKEYNLENIIEYDTFLEVTFNNSEKEIIKIEFNKKFENDSIFPKSNKNIGYRIKETKKDNFTDFLLKEGFTLEGSEYKKVDKNITMTYLGTDRFLIQKVEDDCLESLDARLNNGNVIYNSISEEGKTETNTIIIDDEIDNNKYNEFVNESINYLKYLKKFFN